MHQYNCQLKFYLWKNNYSAFKPILITFFLKLSLIISFKFICNSCLDELPNYLLNFIMIKITKIFYIRKKIK